MGNIRGPLKSLDFSAPQALRQAASSSTQGGIREVSARASAGAREGHIASDTKDLFQARTEASRGGTAIANLSFAEFDEVTPTVHLKSALQLAQSSPANQNELTQIFSQVATPNQINALSEAMGNKPATATAAFKQRFLALSPQEQRVALQIAALLMKKPEPTDLREQLRAQMDSLSPAAPPLVKGEAVGRTLNTLGLYLPNLKPDSVASEDATGRMRTSYMSYHPQTDPNDPQKAYVRSMILLARKENFKLVLQLPKDVDVNAAKQQLMQATGITDAAEFDRLVALKQTERIGYDWGEDGKLMMNDNRSMLVLPTGDNVQASLNAFRNFVQADLGLKPGDPGYATGGHHAADGVDSITQGNIQKIEVDNETPNPNTETDATSVKPESEKVDTGYQFAAEITPGDVRKTRTYNEGGNMVVGTLPNGQPYAVIGQDGVIISTFLLDQKERKKPGSVKELAPEQLAQRRESLGLNRHPLPPAQQLELEQTLKRLQNAETDPNTQKSLTLEDAKNFLAKMDICKDIFAQDTGIPRQNLAFVPQPGFHVDMHMRPLGPGQMLLNDYDKSIALLEKAKQSVPPDSPEARELDTMLAHARARKEQMQPVVEEIARQLKDAGLEVIRAPGIMEGRLERTEIEKDSDIGKKLGLETNQSYDLESFKAALKPIIRQGIAKDLEKKKRQLSPEAFEAAVNATTESMVRQYFGRPVNFMNAIPGSSSGSNTQYYATNYTSLAPLRAEFEAFMREQGIERVEWMAPTAGDSLGRSASEISLILEGGLDCREVHAAAPASSQFA